MSKKKAPLPSKEATLFKELLTLYETRQLKKAHKTADQILKKFPDHGETLCMKGLVLTHMGKRDEGIDLVKKGIKLDLTSHICWHVFGLIQKADKNYDEALKSYTQALRFDKENMNLLRDSAQLQTQLRLYENLVETRHTILRVRPNLRQNWIALAIAHHLNRNLPEARKVLEHYLESLKNVPPFDIEHSETLIYFLHVLEELGEYDQALAALDVSAKTRSIVDRTAVLEFRARILSKKNSPDAERAWQLLIEHNPDSYDSYKGYLAQQGISSSPEAVAKLEAFATQLPRATAPRRLQLNLASGDQFKELVKPYITRGLIKGIPSLFADLKALYSDKEKQQTIEDIVDALREEYTPSDAKDIEPTTYLWTLYFLAQHYSHLAQHTKALTLIELALEHTPTLPELYVLQGRVLKRLGDYVGAAKAMNDARSLDGQDRFLNTKCGVYLLRAGMIDEAVNILGLFTKKDVPTPAHDLEDMQSTLFLLSSASAYLSPFAPSSLAPPHLPQLNMALKRYLSTKKTFDEWDDDQYDFHGYNLRKFTISIYLKLLEWERGLRGRKEYVEAVLGAVGVYVRVADEPGVVERLKSGPALVEKLTDAEKKAKKKAKKAAKKVEDEKKKDSNVSNVDKELDPPPPKDEDPDGFKALGVADPLEQAAKLLQPLLAQEKAKEDVDVWLAVYDVAIRRKKLLQATAALSTALSLSLPPASSASSISTISTNTPPPTSPPPPTSIPPAIHIRLVDLLHRSQLPDAQTQTQTQTPPAPISAAAAFTAALASLVPVGVSAETYNGQYLQMRGEEPEAVLAVAEAARRMGGGAGEVEGVVFGMFGEGRVMTVKTALRALSLLTSLSPPSARLPEFRELAQKRFPRSTAFKSAEELERLKVGVLSGLGAGQGAGSGAGSGAGGKEEVEVEVV